VLEEGRKEKVLYTCIYTQIWEGEREEKEVEFEGRLYWTKTERNILENVL
jgi:hypothetical protein